jgi:crossover junction endodeoxyribonuclease RuvC
LRPSAAKKRPDDRSASVVLGIDPGTLVTGYGVVTGRGSMRRHIASGTIPNRAGTPLADRLEQIYNGLVELIAAYNPTEVAIETAFYGKNVRSALMLGHARGVSILAAAQRHLPLSEYTPREIKKAVVGNGNASKQQVQFMVKSLLLLNERRMPFDASDALAVALCHLERGPAASTRARSWKSYIEAHPERVRQ